MITLTDPNHVSGRGNRRHLDRLPASDGPARIAWKGAGLRLCKAPARLIDINAGGAALVAERPAQPGDVLWVGMRSLPWEWVKATVRAAFPSARQWRYHLAFCEPCPAGLLEEATSTATPARAAPPVEIVQTDDHEEMIVFSLVVP